MLYKTRSKRDSNRRSAVLYSGHFRYPNASTYQRLIVSQCLDEDDVAEHVDIHDFKGDDQNLDLKDANFRFIHLIRFDSDCFHKDFR